MFVDVVDDLGVVEVGDVVYVVYDVYVVHVVNGLAARPFATTSTSLSSSPPGRIGRSLTGMLMMARPFALLMAA